MQAPAHEAVNGTSRNRRIPVAGSMFEVESVGGANLLAAKDWLLIPFDAKHDQTATEPTRFLLTLLR